MRDTAAVNFTPEEFSGEVASVLRDTGITRLQPEYINDQMRDARSDLRQTVNRLAVDPENHEKTIAEFLDKQKNRLAMFTRDVDRDAAVAALMNGREMSRPEAERAVDNALTAYHAAATRAERALDNARDGMEDAQHRLAALAARARTEADRLAATAAKSSLLAALTLIAGAFVSVMAGMLGNRYAYRHYVAEGRLTGARIGTALTKPTV